MEEKDRYQIGVISDTHDNIREDVLDVLRGSDLIIHAGDIGGQEILENLERIAPVVAVRGNMDCEPWTDKLPRSEVVEIGDISIYILHDLLSMNLNPKAAGFDLVISGHTHLPTVRKVEGILFLNPGSAGSNRSGKPPSLAKVEVSGTALKAEILLLKT
ncbi:MAG: metallophosphoesterase family protein [Anaerolineales bacterium]|nr:metallophosphoesterase family protein [Anaerolineales bacterium]